MVHVLVLAHGDPEVMDHLLKIWQEIGYKYNTEVDKGWKERNICVRELKLYDFLVPREILPQVLQDIQSFSIQGTWSEKSHPFKVRLFTWIVKVLIRLLGLEPLPWKRERGLCQEWMRLGEDVAWMHFIPLAWMPDQVDEKGVEWT